MSKTPISDAAEKECVYEVQILDRMRALEEAANGLADQMRGVLEDGALPEHNPQWPAFDQLDECPPGHRHECGSCYRRMTFSAALAAFDELKGDK